VKAKNARAVCDNPLARHFGVNGCVTASQPFSPLVPSTARTRNETASGGSATFHGRQLSSGLIASNVCTVGRPCPSRISSSSRLPASRGKPATISPTSARALNHPDTNSP